MDGFNKGFTSSTPTKPCSDSRGNKSNNENELNQEMTSNVKSPRNKQLPTKNFMNPTISAAIKASVPKKKILGERNETLDALEQTSYQRSSSFRPKPVRSPVVDSGYDMEKDSVVKPYDPVKNYLSPRPKFLRYNPDRRRRILNLQENDEDHIKISTYFEAGLQDSCCQQESVEEAQDVNDEEDEDENGEEDEEEMVEFGEDRCCSLKGFFKVLFVVIALILTTQAICSMNSPSPSQTLESVCGINDWLNRVYGLNISEVGYDPIQEPYILVERLKVGDVYDDSGRQNMSETIEESADVQNAKTDDYVHQDDSDVIQDEILQEDETKASEAIEIGYEEAEAVDGLIEEDVIQDETLQEVETVDGLIEEDDGSVASEVIEVDYVEDETVDGLIEEDDGSVANEKNPQLTNEAEFETANDMEDAAEKELDDVKTNDVLNRSTSFDLTIAVLIGHMLVLTSLGAIYRSRCKKVEKEEFKSTNPQSMVEEEAQVVTKEASLLVQNDVIKEIKHVHNIPSVELLGEFVLGEEEITSNISPEIQTKSFHKEMSTGDSHTVQKQGRKNAQVVAPSPVSVRRSSRLKTRSSVMSP